MAGACCSRAYKQHAGPVYCHHCTAQYANDLLALYNWADMLQCTATVLEEQLQSRLCCVSIKELLDGDGQLEQQYWLDGVHAAPAAWQAVAGSASQLKHSGNVAAS